MLSGVACGILSNFIEHHLAGQRAIGRFSAASLDPANDLLPSPIDLDGFKGRTPQVPVIPPAFYFTPPVARRSEGLSLRSPRPSPCVLLLRDSAPHCDTSHPFDPLNNPLIVSNLGVPRSEAFPFIFPLSYIFLIIGLRGSPLKARVPLFCCTH